MKTNCFESWVKESHGHFFQYCERADCAYCNPANLTPKLNVNKLTDTLFMFLKREKTP